jgi:spore germination protein KC
LAGWMDNSESKGLLWVKGNIKGGNLPIQLNNKKIDIQIIKTKSKIKTVIKDKKLQVDILIDVFSNLDESQVKMDVSDPQVLTSMADLQAKEIKKQILMAFNKSKSLDSDVLGFGNYLYGKYPREWKLMQFKKYDYYQNIILNVDIKSTVNHIGLIRKVSEIKDSK